MSEKNMQKSKLLLLVLKILLAALKVGTFA